MADERPRPPLKAAAGPAPEPERDPGVMAIENVLAERAAKAIEAALDRQERLRARAEKGPPKNKKGRTGYTRKEAAQRDEQWASEQASADANVQALLDAANSFLRTKQPERMMDILKAQGVSAKESAFVALTGESSPEKKLDTKEKGLRLENKYAIKLRKAELRERHENIAERLFKYDPTIETLEQGKERAAEMLQTEWDEAVKFQQSQTALNNAKAEEAGLSMAQLALLEGQKAQNEADLAEAKQSALAARLYVGDHPQSAKPRNQMLAAMAWNAGMTQTAYAEEQDKAAKGLVARLGKGAETFVNIDMEAIAEGDGQILLDFRTAGKMNIPEELIAQYGTADKAYNAVVRGATLRALGIDDADDFYESMTLSMLKDYFSPGELENMIDFFLTSDLAHTVQARPGMLDDLKKEAPPVATSKAGEVLPIPTEVRKGDPFDFKTQLKWTEDAVNASLVAFHSVPGMSQKIAVLTPQVLTQMRRDNDAFVRYTAAVMDKVAFLAELRVMQSRPEE